MAPRHILSFLAVAVLAGCASPARVSFADALGEPGCDFKLPDGDETVCTAKEVPLTVMAEPPLGWVCDSVMEGPGWRYVIHESLTTGEYGFEFHDSRFPENASGVVLSAREPAFVGRWDGTNSGFVPLGRGDGSFSLYIYTVQTLVAEDGAARASVHERWSEFAKYPWLVYDVTLDGQTYTRSGMVYDGQFHRPHDLVIENDAGRLVVDIITNGGYGFDAASPGCTP